MLMVHLPGVIMTVWVMCHVVVAVLTRTGLRVVAASRGHCIFRAMQQGIVHTDIIGSTIITSQGIVNVTGRPRVVQTRPVLQQDTPAPLALIAPALGDGGGPGRAEGLVGALSHSLVPWAERVGWTLEAAPATGRRVPSRVTETLVL